MVYALGAVLLGEAGGDATSPDTMAYVVLAGGFAMIAFVMLRSARRRMAKSRDHDGLSVAEWVALTKPSRDMHDQIGELMAELADLSRQINGQLDTRLARLEILLAEADRAIGRLSDEPGGSRNGAIEAVAPLGVDGQVVADEVEGNGGERPATLTALEKNIVDMAEQGMAATQIAQELGRPTGEIELILALKRRRGRQ